MKRITFIITLIVSSLGVQALTVSDIIKKYKKLPDAQYEVLKEKNLKKKVKTEDLSEEEKELWSNAKRVEIILVPAEEAQAEELASDLNTLDNYSLALSLSTSNDVEVFDTTDGACKAVEPKGGLKSMIQEVINPTIYMDVYGEDISSETVSSDEFLSKPVILIKMMGMIGICYIDGRMRASNAKNVIKMETSTSYTVTATPADHPEDAKTYEVKKSMKL